MPERDFSRFRAAVAEIIRHNRRIRDAVRKVSPFYSGDPNAEEPPRKMRLEELLDPKRNSACRALVELGEALKAYPRGTCPPEPLHLMLGSTLSLIQDELEPLLRCREFNVSATVFTDFYNYLLTPNTMTTDEEHAHNIDEHIARLQRRFCQNSDAGYLFTTQMLERRKKTGRIPPRKKCRGKHYGERDTTLHAVRAQVVAEMRRRKSSSGLSWTKIIAELRRNSAYAARVRGKADATWIRYAKSGFSG